MKRDEEEIKDNSENAPFIDLLNLIHKGAGDFVNKGISKAVSFTSSLLEEVKPIVRNHMKKGFKKIIIRSIIKLLLIALGIVLVITSPINILISHLLASLLFLSVLIWSTVNAIKCIKDYYNLPILIIKMKSIKKGSWQFILFKWPEVYKCIENYKKFKKVTSKYVSKEFEKLPEVEDTVKDFLHYLLKDIIVFLSFFVFYFILIAIVKPILLLSFANLTTWEVYFFPFVVLKNLIVILFIA